MTQRLFIHLLSAGVTMSLAAVAPAAWIVTEAPMLPGWAGGIELSDINSDGVVCGTGNYVANVSATAFRFDGDTVTELPHLVPSSPTSLGLAINASGTVAGHGRNARGMSQAVYWEGTTLHTIPYPPDADTNSDFRAYDINDAGVMVGYHWNTNGEACAFYYQNGVTYSLDSALRAAGLAGYQYANAVNAQGVICGTARDATNIVSSWLYDIPTGAVTLIGRIGADSCSATDINAANQTIGRTKQTSGDIYRAVTYDGAWHLVDSTVNVVQWGEGINDHGRMIGSTATSDARWSWYSDAAGPGSIVRVELPGWTRETFQAINNRDWIVGFGRTASSGSDSRSFIVAPPPGDYDHDGDIDQTDYTAFEGCLSGPKDASGFAAPNAACLRAFDFDPADGDVDLTDFAVFQTVFEGP